MATGPAPRCSTTDYLCQRFSPHNPPRGSKRKREQILHSRAEGGKRSVWQPTSLPTWHWRSRGLEGWTDRVVEYVDRGERGRANLQWCKSKREVRKDMAKGEEFLYKYIFVCSHFMRYFYYIRVVSSIIELILVAIIFWKFMFASLWKRRKKEKRTKGEKTQKGSDQISRSKGEESKSKWAEIYSEMWTSPGHSRKQSLY